MAESLSLEEEKMKNYTITVNGNVYEVTVEEGAAGAAPTPAAAPKAAPKEMCIRDRDLTFLRRNSRCACF